MLCQVKLSNIDHQIVQDAIDGCREAINKTMKEDTKVQNILQLGDFDFPFISWSSKSIYSQMRESKSSEKRQA